MEKIVVFDWGGVIMHKHPIDNNDRQAIIRAVRGFNLKSQKSTEDL